MKFLQSSNHIFSFSTSIAPLKLDGNYTRMVRVILNKSWKQHPTKQHLYCHQPPITKTIQIRRTRDTGHCWRRTNSKAMYSCGTLHIDEQRLDDQLEPIYYSVPIQDIAWKTTREWWSIETGGERVIGRSVLAARHDDDDDGSVQTRKELVPEFNYVHLSTFQITHGVNQWTMCLRTN